MNNNDDVWMVVGFLIACVLFGPIILAALFVFATVVVPILIGGAILWAVCIAVGNMLTANGHLK